MSTCQKEIAKVSAEMVKACGFKPNFIDDSDFEDIDDYKLPTESLPYKLIQHAIKAEECRLEATRKLSE